MVCLPRNLMQSQPEITISFTSIDKVKHIISEDIIETSINMLVCHHTHDKQDYEDCNKYIVYFRRQNRKPDNNFGYQDEHFVETENNWKET